ncbi:trypsin-like serine protease [Paraburkholderia sediminicola]|uniref:trypsin-like serine protease n=1 Tax=Paraburkholderia sediminicola TaxID=458836 RepID=UPI0038BB8327
MRPIERGSKASRSAKLTCTNLFLIVTAVFFAISAHAEAAGGPATILPGSLLLFSPSDFPPPKIYKYTAPATLLVGNFTLENPKGYLASIQTAVDGVHFCTWFMINSRTLVSAAHCLYNNIRDVEFGHLEKYRANCELPSEFGINHPLDLTLCLLEKSYILSDIEKSRGDGFESVETNKKNVKTGKIIRISGYGCHSPGGKVQKEYAIGESRIYKLPPYTHLPGSTEPTPNLIQVRQAPSFLCDGDSGGPAFLFNDDTGLRSVFGVNAATATLIESGYLTSLLTEDSKTFLSGWAQKHGQRICGLHSDSVDCRQ